MNSLCPHQHVSFASWRLRVLRKLYTTSDRVTDTYIPLLNPPSFRNIYDGTRTFHTSNTRARSHIKDSKRSANYRAVQLELKQYVETGKQPSGRKISKRPLQHRKPKDPAEWNPYTEEGLEELQSLVGDLQAMTKEASNKAESDSNEDLPFKFAPKTFTRKNNSDPKSPLELKLPWARGAKKRVDEVEVDKKLENNVWAQLLASPIRTDRGTRARLPRDLMIGFGIVQNESNKKNYVLPLELADLDGLRQELQAQNSIRPQEPQQDDQDEAKPVRTVPRPGTRIPIYPSKLALQEMTDEFTYTKPGTGPASARRATHGARLSGGLIPHRWREKQERMLAFAKTRQKFNETLNREPDKDEPDLTELTNYSQLQWQGDIVHRLERIMRKRIAICLEAVGKDNASGRAIHDRRVVAMPMPENGHLYFGDKGQLTLSLPSSGLNTDTPPDWIHGAICLHIGTSEQYKQFLDKCITSTLDPDNHDGLGTLPSGRLIPPTITVNSQFRLPLFNLTVLFGEAHASKPNRLIEENKVFNLNFWIQYNQTGSKKQETSSASDSATDATTSSDLNSNDSITSEPSLPSLTAAGEQVLSSIIPQTDTPSTSTSATTDDISPPQPTEPYIILIKSRAAHAAVLTRELWQLWRYLGGRKATEPKSSEDQTVAEEMVQEQEE